MELGSEYDLDLNKLNISSNNLFHYLESYNCQFFDSGRSALRHIPFNQNKAVLLPEFICESVSNCFPSQNIIFYNITEDLQIDLDDLKPHRWQHFTSATISVPFSPHKSYLICVVWQTNVV